MAGPSDSRRPPLQKNLSRRVSFNESTLSGKSHKPPPSITTTDSSDMESQVGIGGGGRPRRRGCGPICNSCCAWTSLILGILLIVLILLGGIYYAFLQSNLPEVRLQELDVFSVNVTTTNSGDTLLAARIVAHLNTTNGSGQIELGYSSMIARLSSAGIDFPEVRVVDVRQEPHNTTNLWVEAYVSGMAVEEAAAGELKNNADRHLMVVDVVVRGKVDFFVGGKRMSGFPFRIDCQSIDESEVDNGHAPRCSTKMTPIH